MRAEISMASVTSSTANRHRDRTALLDSNDCGHPLQTAGVRAEILPTRGFPCTLDRARETERYALRTRRRAIGGAAVAE